MSEDKRDKWEMPKPIFRQSSGFQPKGFAKREERWDDSTPPDVKGADPNNAMLLTMYAPPGDLTKDPQDEQAMATAAAVAPSAAIEPAMATAAAAAPGAAIEPQPGITEQFSVEPAVVEPSPVVRKKRGFFGKFVIVLGVVALLAAGFAVLIYYLFFSSQAQNNNF